MLGDEPGSFAGVLIASCAPLTRLDALLMAIVALPTRSDALLIAIGAPNYDVFALPIAIGAPNHDVLALLIAIDALNHDVFALPNGAFEAGSGRITVTERPRTGGWHRTPWHRRRRFDDFDGGSHSLFPGWFVRRPTIHRSRGGPRLRCDCTRKPIALSSGRRKQPQPMLHIECRRVE